MVCKAAFLELQNGGTLLVHFWYILSFGAKLTQGKVGKWLKKSQRKSSITVLLPMILFKKMRSVPKVYQKCTDTKVLIFSLIDMCFLLMVHFLFLNQVTREKKIKASKKNISENKYGHFD